MLSKIIFSLLFIYSQYYCSNSKYLIQKHEINLKNEFGFIIYKEAQHNNFVNYYSKVSQCVINSNPMDDFKKALINHKKQKNDPEPWIIPCEEEPIEFIIVRVAFPIYFGSLMSSKEDNGTIYWEEFILDEKNVPFLYKTAWDELCKLYLTGNWQQKCDEVIIRNYKETPNNNVIQYRFNEFMASEQIDSKVRDKRFLIFDTNISTNIPLSLTVLKYKINVLRNIFSYKTIEYLMEQSPSKEKKEKSESSSIVKLIRERAKGKSYYHLNLCFEPLATFLTPKDIYDLGKQLNIKFP